MKILLIVYDNASYIHWFPQGTAYIAAALLEAGHDVEIYSQDVHHYPETHLTEFLDKNTFDVVGVSLIAGYYQYRKIMKISEAINRSKHRPYYILGGFGPSPEPEHFLKKTGADVVVIGEGELTVVELLEAVANHSPLQPIKGIAFLAGEKVVITPRRPLIQDLETIAQPAYELFPIEYYRLLRRPHSTNSDFLMPVLSGRGCTFLCSFCYRMDKGLRIRQSEGIIEEVRFLKTNYGINHIDFTDELLMSSFSRVEELSQAIIDAKLDITWTCSGRLNFAKPDLLQLMKKSGCVFINYGIEAMDDDVLKNMKKGLRVAQVYKGIIATLEAGISPGFNIIFGNIGDSQETLNKGVEFLLKYDDGSQMRTIRPVTPYPGSPLYYDAIEKGLLKDCTDFYENKHLNSDLLAVNFTEMSDDEFHMALMEANACLLENYFEKKKEMSLQQVRNLYTGKDDGFRGFRQS